MLQLRQNHILLYQHLDLCLLQFKLQGKLVHSDIDSVVEQEETVDNIIQDLLADIPVEDVSHRGGEIVEVEPEAAAVVECCTNPKKQKTTLLEKLLVKSLKVILPQLLFQRMKLC